MMHSMHAPSTQMASTPGSSTSSIGLYGSSSTLPWKEHVLDEIPVRLVDIGDVLTALLHTILFTRAPGPVRPSEASCHAFPRITYALCAVGDVSRKVDHAVRSFEDSVHATHPTNLPAGPGGPYGSTIASTVTGCVVVTFFERKVKKALFGLMSNEEKLVFEKWVLPLSVAVTSEECEVVAEETETALQHSLLQILSVVQTIEHIPNAMYDFEISAYGSRDAMQNDHSYSTSVRLMA